MKCYFLLLTLILFFSNAEAQNLWSVTTTSDATAESNDVVLDAAGNAYITGYISGDTEFQEIEIDMVSGYSNAFVAKVDPSGKYEWVKIFKGPQSDKGIKLALTSTNEIVFTGTYYETIDFGGTILNSVSGSKDIFLVKLDQNGDVVWARSDGGSQGDNPYGLTLDASDNIILTGQFQGVSTIGTSTFTSMVDPITLLDSYEIFLAKFDSNGNPLWSKASYAEYEDRGLAVTCDASDNIYLTGQFSDTIDFFGQTINNEIYNAGFVSRFTPAGGLTWIDKLTAGQVLTYDIELDLTNNLVVTGDFLGKLILFTNDGLHTLDNPYSRKVFVLKLNLDGDFIWARANGSESEVTSRTVAIDANNDIYIGGHFKCTFSEFSDSTASHYWQSLGFRDIFVTKFSSSGQQLWKTNAGSQRDDVCWGMTLNGVDLPLLTGSYTNTFFIPMKTGYSPGAFVTNPIFQNYIYKTEDRLYVGHPGDISANILLTNLINANSYYINYYPMGEDSLQIYIIPTDDSVDFCPLDRAGVFTNIVRNSALEPLLIGKWSSYSDEYIWNDYIENPYRNLDWLVDSLERDGMYVLNMRRLDQCYATTDSIYIDYHPYPRMPYLTDDHGVNVSDTIYKNLEVCPPDTLLFSFTNPYPFSTSILVIENVDNGPGNYSDTLVMDSIYQIDFDAEINVRTISQYGCISDEDFLFDIYDSIKYDPIDPYLLLNDAFDRNDSIMICRNQFVTAIVADSITNPNGNLEWYDEPTVSRITQVTRNGMFIANSTHFKPDSTGWYLVDVDLTLGHLETLCEGVDTTIYHVMDSFYVDIRENPKLNLLGAALMCPDTYNFLYVDSVIQGMTWIGSNILWTSSDLDSIKFNESGMYGVQGIYDYGEVSCEFKKTVSIGEKMPPVIKLNPIDGIVCPFDSVHLTLDESGIAYDWIGPEGSSVSNQADIYAKDQGFYACIFTDSSGCELLTTPAEIKEYTTPFLELSPSSILCENATAEIYVIYDGLAQINWLAPLSGSSDIMVINAPGTYICEITQCGITTRDSVTFYDGTFDVSLSVSDSTLCYGDTVIVLATPGYTLYEWSNGFVNSAFLDVTEAGDYSVKVFNEFGCWASSDTVTIYKFDESEPPLIENVALCYGGDALFTDTSSFTVLWYVNPSDPLPFYVGDSLALTNIIKDTTLYAAYQSANCPLVFEEVSANIKELLLPPSITGDNVLCSYDSLVFETTQVGGISYVWTYNGDTVSQSNELIMSPFGDSLAGSIILHIEDECSENQSTMNFVVNPISPLVFSAYSDTVCVGDAVEINSTGSGTVTYNFSDGTLNWQSGSFGLSYSDLLNDSIWVSGTNVYGCNSDTVLLNFVISPLVSTQLSQLGTSCLGNSILLSANPTLGNLTWTAPDGSQYTVASFGLDTVDINDFGYYSIQWQDLLQCQYNDSILVSEIGLPVFDLGQDTVLCSDLPFQLQAPSGPYTFVWNNTDTVSVFVPNGVDYAYLTLIDINGCRYTDSILIQFMPCTGAGANIVTANGDGINEYFVIFNAELMPLNYLRVFNRWGNVVFEESFYRNTYSPFDLTDGVYFYEFYPDGLGGRKEMGYFQLVKQ